MLNLTGWNDGVPEGIGGAECCFENEFAFSLGDAVDDDSLILLSGHLCENGAVAQNLCYSLHVPRWGIGGGGPFAFEDFHDGLASAGGPEGVEDIDDSGAESGGVGGLEEIGL